MPRYAELQVTTNFSFLRGASHGEELVAQAKALGLEAIALTDRNTLSGVVRAHLAAKEVGLKLIVGARLDLQDGLSLLCLPRDRAAYGRLSRLLSLGQLRAGKGQCTLYLDDVASHAEGQIFIALAPDGWDWREAASSASAEPEAPRSGAVLPFRARSSTPTPALPLPGGGREDGKRNTRLSPLASPNERAGGGTFADQKEAYRFSSPPHVMAEPCSAWTRGRVRVGGESQTLEAALLRVKARLGDSPLYLAASHTYRGDDRARLAALARLSDRCATPLVATGDVLYHAPHRRALQDVLTCVREKTTIDEAGLRLEANAERHLKRGSEMARLFKGHAEAVARTIEIMEACRFSLEELVYEYPDEPVPAGKSPQAHLEALTWEGARWRFPDGIPDNVHALIERELALIAELQYAPYFLTVHDIVHFARSQKILCQGRGSAANSAVCYCLAITAVNPTEIDLLFERFVSPERREPPDIDVDFEHERREEVIQYIYARYGRDRAGIAATVISYRARSAVRDIGKAMGLSEDTVAALAGMVWGTASGGVLPEAHVREAGLDPTDPLLTTVLELTHELMGFPRHLSQHVGGFVLTRGPLVEVVPVGNAAMEDRTFIEWDKDDIAALGLLKVDVLALGMLTCIRKAFDLIEKHEGKRWTLATLPREDEAVYDMLCRADSIGVFQVESRAQMNMLPRLKPRCFYDLVIEVAIVRPGPIQGDMVHPYLRRRGGVEPEHYPSPAPAHGPKDELKNILGKTKGVPLFQEQAMRIALVAAKFSDAEVNELRKAMATFRRRGTIGLLEEKMVSRMAARGYDREFAQRCFNQIKGFGEYGFPESHAASFAHLVYVSAWIKCHHPAAFAAALLNSQPMGFYAPAQIVRDAREHGVEAREVDVNLSDWDCTLEPEGADGRPALRLGLRQIEGLAEDEAQRLVSCRSPITPTPPLPLPGGGRENAEGFHFIVVSKARLSPNILFPSPLEGEGQGGGCSSNAKEDPRWPISERGNSAATPRKRSGSSGRSCATNDSLAIGSDASIRLDRSSSISSASNDGSSSRSMAASTVSEQKRSAIGDELSGSKRKVSGSCASGTGTCVSTFTMRSKQYSVRFPEGRKSTSTLDGTPTPPLPLEGGGRENGKALIRVKGGRGRGNGRGLGHFSSPLAGEDDAAAQRAQARIAGASGGGRFRHTHDLWLRARVKLGTLQKLAAADAFRSLGLDRRQALWEVKALGSAEPLPLFSWSETREAGLEPEVALPEMPLSEHVVNDYQTLRLSLKAHPMSFLRAHLDQLSAPPARKRGSRILSCEELRGAKDGAWVAIAGVVLVRQRPGSAKGVVFMTIEDETGIANAVVWPKTLERFRKVVMGARLIVIHGRIQRHEDIIHVVSQRLEDRSDWLALLSEHGPEMKAPLANADHVKSPDIRTEQTGLHIGHPRWAGRDPRLTHPREVRIIPKSRDFH